ncbi:pilus assembly protein [Frankia sp. CNm7]|uniref:Pilus assembly protein n=1 Tax=Frankia nepalensis TaxID=1836974 RepID=A0A937RQK9_9ACTN|nr:TadE/TadG family type IV pilus assembly protein [Frankia nepalensis]MBL7498277.1 pilus assembly protein [Frankia nepalensis]MBL7509131.1 pilus assembly protein [Frankia nepalensis]MBL7521713.1 pilus assembly protein [Frankia nepalensis]MBL7630176.1 pilus assembly protein [Frankia nepalensis]
MTAATTRGYRRPAAGRRRGAAGGGDRGSFSVELALAWPILILGLLVLAVAATSVGARTDVARAAREAARAASLATTPEQASAIADATARANLATGTCTDVVIHTGLTATGPTPGDLGLVTVTVSCRTRPIPGLGLTRELRATGDAVLDRYRGGLTLPVAP